MPGPARSVFNTAEEKNVLAKSLRQSKDVGSVVECLDYVIENHTPFGLYIATEDKNNCMWIFDPEALYDMLGGKDIHDKTFRSVFDPGYEREHGILFYVLRKVGPIIATKFCDASLDDIRRSLQADVA